MRNKGSSKSVLTFIVLALLVVVLLLLIVRLISGFDKSLTLDWDELSFVGALIGGAITYYGVSYTIKNDQNQRFIDSWPDKLPSIKVVREYFSQVVVLAFNTSVDGHGVLNHEMHEHLKGAEQALVKSAKISGKVYFYCSAILKKQSALESFLMAPSGYVFHDNRTFESISNDLDNLLLKLNKELDNLESKFIKLAEKSGY